MTSTDITNLDNELQDTVSYDDSSDSNKDEKINIEMGERKPEDNEDENENCSLKGYSQNEGPNSCQRSTSSKYYAKRLNNFHLVPLTSVINNDPPSPTDATDAIPEYMKFTYLDVLTLIMSISTFLFDFITDLVVCALHYLNGDYSYFYLTIGFTAVPTLVMTLMSLRWYILDSSDPTALKISKTQLWFRVIFLTLQLSPVLRYIDTILFGLKFRKLNQEGDRKAARKYFQYMIYEDTDATMLRLFECFMEAAPQLVLQTSIMVLRYKDPSRLDLTMLIQAVSVFFSLMSLSWSLVSYFRILRLSIPHKQNLTWPGTIVQFLWRFCMLASRVFALALFASEYTYYIGIVCSIHWFIMFVWIVSMKTTFCYNQCEELFYNAVLGVVFIFCYFNPVDRPSRYCYTFYYFVMFVENSILFGLWFHVSTHSEPFRIVTLVFYFVAFILGIIIMIIYYLKYHPTKNIKIFQTSDTHADPLSRPNNQSTESNNSLNKKDSKTDGNVKLNRKHHKHNYGRQFSNVSIWAANGRLLHPRPAVPIDI